MLWEPRIADCQLATRSIQWCGLLSSFSRRVVRDIMPSTQGGRQWRVAPSPAPLQNAASNEWSSNAVLPLLQEGISQCSGVQQARLQTWRRYSIEATVGCHGEIFLFRRRDTALLQGKGDRHTCPPRCPAGGPAAPAGPSGPTGAAGSAGPAPPASTASAGGPTGPGSTTGTRLDQFPAVPPPPTFRTVPHRRTHLGAA